MESVIVQIISAISPSALPIVVCVLGIAYIYFKINTQRKVTKTERDNAHDNLDKRLTLVEIEIKRLKDLDLDARLASIETSLKYIESLLKDLKDKD